MSVRGNHRGTLIARSSKRGRSDRSELWIVLAILAVVLHELQWILSPFVIAGLIAYLGTPLVERLAISRSRHTAAVVVFLFLFAVISGMALLGAPPLARELTRLVVDIQSIFENLAKSAMGEATISLLGRQTNATQLARTATEGVREWIEQPGRISAIGAASFAGTFSIFLTLVLLFYFLLSGRRILQGLLWLAPAEERPLLQEVWRRLDPMLKRYFIGVIIVVIYATIAAYVGLGLVLGLHHAVFLALLTGVLEMIPVAGPGASAVIAGLVAVRHAAGIGSILAYAIYAAALRLSIDQLLGPLVLGAAARLHPVLIIFSFLAGGALFGLPGVILAAPMNLVLKIALTVIRGEPDSDMAAASQPKG